MSVFEGTWFKLDRKVRELKRKYARPGESDFELHAAALRRPYPEQEAVPDFENLGAQARYDAVMEIRQEKMKKVWPGLRSRHRKSERRTYQATEPFLHLLYEEREQLLDDALGIVGGYSRGITLFADAVNKSHPKLVDAVDLAFSQVVTRFEAFLSRRQKQWGLLAVDHDQAKARRLTTMVEGFQRTGTQWREIDRVIEAPFFFDSKYNAGVQLADLCTYSVRRYLENNESERFELIFDKFDRTSTGLHGIRHFTPKGCGCLICRERGHG